MAKRRLETEEEMEMARYKLDEPENDDETKQWASLIWLEAWNGVALRNSLSLQGNRLVRREKVATIPRAHFEDRWAIDRRIMGNQWCWWAIDWRSLVCDCDKRYPRVKSDFRYLDYLPPLVNESFVMFVI